MANERDERRTDEITAPQQAGDNRRAGDTDGNAVGGNSKSKGAENPADERPEDDQRRRS
jgi:hypothetical protein